MIEATSPDPSEEQRDDAAALLARPDHVPYLDTVQAGIAPETSHPAYVAVAPEWFWNEGDPRAPFSSDDGHDTLQVLQGHFIQGGGDEHLPGCVASLIVDWGLVPERIWESSQAEIEAWLDSDPNHVAFLHSEIDAYVAAACGQFKTSGWIHPSLRFWAERAMMLLEHVLAPWAEKAFGTDPGSYDEKLDATRRVVEAAPDPPRSMQLPMYEGRQAGR